MPQIPTYQFQVRPSDRGLGFPGAAMTQVATPYAQEVIHVGRMIEHRSAQLLAEYDSAKAYDAFTDLRNRTRDKLYELLSREGGSAIGVQDEYKGWEKEQRDSINKDRFDAQSQKSIFDQLADRHREADLKHLASHEAHELGVYKKSTLMGIGEVLERESRINAFDDEKLNTIIGEYFSAEDRLYPNRLPEEKTAERLKALSGFRFSSMLELIEKNPSYAVRKMEEWKPELGDKYEAVKRMLDGKFEEDKLTAALAFGQNKFGSNYEAASHYFSQAKNFGEWGGDYRTAKELVTNFRGMANEREQIESRSREAHNRMLAQNDFNFLVAMNDPNPNAPRPNAQDLAKKGLISLEAYKYYLSKKETSENDNPFVYIDLYQRMLKDENIYPDMISQNLAGNISDRTVKALGKAMVDDKVRKAYRSLDIALAPGEAERAPDRALKYYDANERLRIAIEAGQDPQEAAKEVIEAYTVGIKRTWSTLPQQTRFLTGDRKNPYEISLAKQKAATALAQGEISIDEYKKEMRDLEKMSGLAREQFYVDEEAEQRRQEEKKKSTLPGGR
jgi:hypothetical protein